jgi:hypothetical protein
MTLEFTDLIRTAPGTPGGQCMRRFWHLVFLASDLKPGWAKPLSDWPPALPEGSARCARR